MNKIQPELKHENIRATNGETGADIAVSVYINMHDGIFTVFSDEFGYQKYNSFKEMTENWMF